MAQITYDTKVALNENSSIAAINKISADDMNEIKTVVNTNDTAVGDLSTLTTTATTVVGAINEVNAKTDNYSTTEIKTNKLWIDNKPIYRKVVNTGTLPDSTTKQIEHGISNLKRILNIFGYAYTPNGQSYPLPWINATNVTYQTALYCDSTYIYMSTGTGRSNITESYVILEYTKTTD